MVEVGAVVVDDVLRLVVYTHSQMYKDDRGYGILRPPRAARMCAYMYSCNECILVIVLSGYS